MLTKENFRRFAKIVLTMLWTLLCRLAEVIPFFCSFHSTWTLILSITLLGFFYAVLEKSIHPRFEHTHTRYAIQHKQHLYILYHAPYVHRNVCTVGRLPSQFQNWWFFFLSFRDYLHFTFCSFLVRMNSRFFRCTLSNSIFSSPVNYQNIFTFLALWTHVELHLNRSCKWKRQYLKIKKKQAKHTQNKTKIATR